MVRYKWNQQLFILIIYITMLIHLKISDDLANFDLQSAYNYIIKPHDNSLIKTDLAISVPEIVRPTSQTFYYFIYR